MMSAKFRIVVSSWEEGKEKEGKECSKCFHYTSLAFLLKVMWNRYGKTIKDLRSCNEFMLFVHYCFLMLYCILETFYCKNVKNFRQESSYESQYTTLDTCWIQSLFHEYQGGPWAGPLGSTEHQLHPSAALTSLWWGCRDQRTPFLKLLLNLFTQRIHKKATIRYLKASIRSC